MAVWRPTWGQSLLMRKQEFPRSIGTRGRLLFDHVHLWLSPENKTQAF
jgi:hypothetical protein